MYLMCMYIYIFDTIDSMDTIRGSTRLWMDQVMGKEMSRRYKELSDEGDACLLSLTNINKRVGQAFVHLKEVCCDLM